ncbi:hypothetical protein JAAARDRAFT_32780 [Jaapia argillacea MUCL 33604]|uniref:DUF6533 domain-containing protein n=1 Tax=Jaapia argillacea MUCL 33604 TaxID=933084 RepID=A0A067PZY4_9AGAM|nr:hypothetical protein JAAARDRAFT_32780 [Jaapia argillacea MUCL 33604]
MDSDSDAASDATNVFIHNYLSFVAISILYYDHLLTFGQEVNQIWREKTSRSFWFFLNRYLAFFGNIVVSTVGNQDLSDERCKQYALFRQFLLVANQVIVCIILTLRTFALYHRDLRILFLMVGVGALLFAVACWSLVGQQSSPADVSGCHISDTDTTGIHIAAAWEALIAYDALVFILTVLKTYHRGYRYRAPGAKIDLVGIMLRDGAIYFAVIGFVNAMNIVTYYLASVWLIVHVQPY